jgi:hypothetical protein
LKGPVPLSPEFFGCSSKEVSPIDLERNAGILD